jgi:hypothetical protein
MDISDSPKDSTTTEANEAKQLEEEVEEHSRFIRGAKYFMFISHTSITLSSS